MFGSESIDTNVILRIILRDDEAAMQRAIKLISNGKDFALDDVAISEAVYVLEKASRWQRVSIAAALAEILAVDNIICNKGLIEDTLNLYLKHPKLSFNDCYLATKAGLSQAVPFWTYDRKLASQVEYAQLV